MARQRGHLSPALPGGVRAVRTARPGALLGGAGGRRAEDLLQPRPRGQVRELLAAPSRTTGGVTMSMRPITTTSAPAPSGGYSQGIVAEPFLFLSGQGPFDEAGELVNGSIEAQVRQVFANLQAVAEAAGTSLAQAL